MKIITLLSFQAAWR